MKLLIEQYILKQKLHQMKTISILLFLLLSSCIYSQDEIYLYGSNLKLIKVFSDKRNESIFSYSTYDKVLDSIESSEHKEVNDNSKFLLPYNKDATLYFGYYKSKKDNGPSRQDINYLMQKRDSFYINKGEIFNSERSYTYDSSYMINGKFIQYKVIKNPAPRSYADLSDGIWYYFMVLNKSLYPMFKMEIKNKYLFNYLNIYYINKQLMIQQHFTHGVNDTSRGYYENGNISYYELVDIYDNRTIQSIRYDSIGNIYSYYDSICKCYIDYINGKLSTFQQYDSQEKILYSILFNEDLEIIEKKIYPKFKPK